MNSIYFLITIYLIVIAYHIILYFTRDKFNLNVLQKFNDPEIDNIDELKEIPLINIIIPAWNEGNEFKECLQSIIDLKYPKIKTIVNAGGNEETIKIANTFKKYDNFIILQQTGGKERAAFGKIRALNECLQYISEGLIYFIDADCFLTDEILLKMILPIVNLNENVVISSYRPLKHQENKDLIKYLQFNRFGPFFRKVHRYSQYLLSGANTCTTYYVIKKIGSFKEDRFIAEDVSRANDILAQRFKIYCLFNYNSRIYSQYPNNLKEYTKQTKRYIENSFLLAYKSKNKEIEYWHNFIRFFLKLFVLLFVFLYLLIFPIFLFYHLGLFFLGFVIITFLYLKKIRKYLFFKKCIKNQIDFKLKKRIFLKIFYYIYIEIIINVIALFGLISFRKKIKSEFRNISKNT